MRLARPLAVLSVSFALGACALVTVSTAATAGGPMVSKSTVQTQAAKILAAKTGQKLPKVSCPTGVAAKVGAVIHCTVVPYGKTLRYPVTITVQAIHGSTANFYVQVGQALGQANQAMFCADNATINSVLTAATTPSAFLAALQANEQVILEFQSVAPTKIVDAAGTLVTAARQAITTGNIAIFNTKAVAQAATAVDRFCGQSTQG